MSDGWRGVILVIERSQDLADLFPAGVPWEGRCAPALVAKDGSGGLAQQLVVTDEEFALLQAAFPLWVYDCTLGGVANCSLRFPQFQWYPATLPADADPENPPPLPPSLGFVAGFEPTAS